MSVSTQIQKMIDDLTGLQGDAAKVDAGQKSAATRVRKAMQTLKTQAQEVRASALEKAKGEG
jgi:hypothetical protein